MAYGTPTDPVAGTVITVAYAVANILDPIRWLRQMTGNADPPGSNYVVVSSSTTATAWSKVPDDALANAKVNKAGDTMSGSLSVTGTVTASGNVSSSGGGGVFAGGVTCASGGGTFAGAVSGTQLQSSIATGTAPLTVASTTKVTNLNADLLDGVDGSGYQTALGFTPSRIVSGTYSGTGATSARQITTGWAVKFVIIHQPSADVMYIANNTTSSLRLGPSPTFVQGSASVHTHASDGFVVSDGSVQGNVAGSDNYSYTAFG